MESIDGDDALLSLSAVNESDQVWLNGNFIGKTWFVRGERKYNFPAKYLIKGNNTLIISIKDTDWRGGLWGESDGYFIENGSQKIDLTGNWLVRLGLSQIPPRPVTFGRLQTPTIYYNAMIAPLTHYAICGAIWYQGESNTGRAAEYETLFTNMITSWRDEWAIGDFPFYFVQIADVGSKNQNTEDTFWVELQEQQQKTLKLHNTGMAVVNDIGDFDIHPTNKQEVGLRLALIALHNHYKKVDIIYSGPVFKHQIIKDNTIELEFIHVGNGLVAKDRYGYLKHFAIAGESGEYVWAQAYIKNDSTVVVSSPNVKKPLYVRYAWATNPFDANLYNSAGLPASCFRTDNFPLKSSGYKYDYYRFSGK